MATTEQPLIRDFDHTIHLPVFEGPLDLLLFLIRKNEIDIYDIPIGTVTRQYLQMLHEMEEMNLEVAGEFFVMAANLMYIKSRVLLPKDEQIIQEDDEEEEIDPRWELVQQLIEYKKFKDAAHDISHLVEEAQNLYYRRYYSRQEEKPERPLKPTDHITLWNVFNQVLRRLSEKIIIGEIHDDTITVAERMEDILGVLREKKTFLFTELITGKAVSAPYVISTFLALLELTRLRHLAIVQTDNFSDIQCNRVDGNTSPAPTLDEADVEDLTYGG